MRISISRAAAVAAASLGLVVGASAHAGTFTVLKATGSSSFSASQGFGEGSSGSDVANYTGLGHFDFSNATAGGFTELLKAPSVQAVLDGSNTGNAGATMTYEFVFTATHPGEVRSLVQDHFELIDIACPANSTAQLCVSPPPQPPLYYIPDATTISGAYSIEADGYARGRVSAYAFGPPGDLGTFQTDCGYGSFSGCGKDDFTSGNFSIFGALMADNDSIDANSFYGFITLSANGSIFEGGGFNAFIDPMITLDLPGVDPKDFTLTISPNLTEGSGGIPEPATWALMLGGFGLAGAALRRRRLAVAA